MIRAPILPLIAAATLLAAADSDYTLGPDSQRHPGVPEGKVTKLTWAASRVFPGTTRDYWVYVPAQYDAAKPACLMVFQDGASFVSETGNWRVPIVFDNLIQQGAMPVTIAVLIDPGVLPAASPDQQNRYNRSYEYDALGPRYSRFLIEEILSEVSKQYRISENPNDRAIAGSSSGGIAAFTAAWERPDSFRRVLSFIGSYTNLRGGDIYANLVRKMEPLPLRVFQQDGSNDQSSFSGSWYLANQAMAQSLAYAGYDSKFVVGTGTHSSKHGGSILPDALRWLWRDYPGPIQAGTGLDADRHVIAQILDPGHDWEPVGEGYQFTEGPAVDREGTVYFCDAGASRIYRVAADGQPRVWKSDTGGATGLMFGVDGRLYAAESQRKRVVMYAPDGRVTVLAEGMEPNDLAVTPQGGVYFTDSPGRRIWYVAPGTRARVVFDAAKDGNMVMPNGVRLSPDRSLAIVADTVNRFSWSFRIAPDGSLADGAPFYHLEMPDDPISGPPRSGADGLTVDTEGFAYFATKLGVQICDQPGRVVAIVRNPSTSDLSNLVFGGKDLDWLYATARDKVFRRHLRRKGLFPWQSIKPPQPRL
jgi:sugar lactone lactonase YvrE/enterochelin esterase-like enzyme